MGLDCRIRIIIEDEKICLYRKNNSGIESFYANSFGNSVEIKPGQSIIFSVINSDSFLKYVSIEYLFLKLMSINRKKRLDAPYISKSLFTLKSILNNFSNDSIEEKNENINSKLFRYNFKGYIHSYKNTSNSSINLKYKNAKIIANISPFTEVSNKYVKKKYI